MSRALSTSTSLRWPVNKNVTEAGPRTIAGRSNAKLARHLDADGDGTLIHSRATLPGAGGNPPPRGASSSEWGPLFAMLSCSMITAAAHPCASKRVVRPIETPESAVPPIGEVSLHATKRRYGPTADSCTAAKYSYSITSSARVSRAGGTSIPSCPAVLRLMTNSNLVGCTIGSSEGFSPLRMRAA